MAAACALRVPPHRPWLESLDVAVAGGGRAAHPDVALDAALEHPLGSALVVLRHNDTAARRDTFSAAVGARPGSGGAGEWIEGRAMSFRVCARPEAEITVAGETAVAGGLARTRR